jgi:hypothetical protein
MKLCLLALLSRTTFDFACEAEIAYLEILIEDSLDVNLSFFSRFV